MVILIIVVDIYKCVKIFDDSILVLEVEIGLINFIGKLLNYWYMIIYVIKMMYELFILIFGFFSCFFVLILKVCND